MTILTADHNCNAIVEYENGDTVNIYATKLYLHQLTQFKHWFCEAGSSRIFILPDGSVWSGECQNDFLGNLAQEGGFTLLTKETICKQELCINNPDDLMVKKYINRS